MAQKIKVLMKIYIDVIKLNIGVKLMSWGAKLALNHQQHKDLFKAAINRNTTIGSVCDSGDHIRRDIKPMCDYDTQSVINVLRHQYLTKPDFAFGGHQTSQRRSLYEEVWTATGHIDDASLNK